MGLFLGLFLVRWGTCQSRHRLSSLFLFLLPLHPLLSSIIPHPLHPPPLPSTVTTGQDSRIGTPGIDQSVCRLRIPAQPAGSPTYPGPPRRVWSTSRLFTSCSSSSQRVSTTDHSESQITPPRGHSLPLLLSAGSTSLQCWKPPSLIPASLCDALRPRPPHHA